MQFWFDFASTYSYPAALRIEALAQQQEIPLTWHAFLLGTIFQAQGWNDSPFNLFPVQAMSVPRSQVLVVASIVLVVLLARSGASPTTGPWALEVFPVVIALPLLWATYRRFPLTTLVYGCIFLHVLVLMLGAMYTDARVPLGFDLAEWLGLTRNPYDQIGHFFQGFVPALVAREILLRGHFVRGKKMLAFVVVCVVLAISATYEFIEWGVALALGQGADQFLGIQGDPVGHSVQYVFCIDGRGHRFTAAFARSRSSDPAYRWR